MQTRRRPRRLVVTGGTGFLGQHIITSPAAEAFEIIAPASNVLDLRQDADVRNAFDEWRPDAVIHTAYRRGDRPSNVDATRHVATASMAVGARLVHVSTDALFAGRNEPYTELDPPTPIHDYGHDKADAEALVADLRDAAVTVRTSLIFGTTRPSLHEVAVRDAIAGVCAMSFFTDEYRSAVLVDDLAAALVELAGVHEITGLLHLGGPTPLSRAELAVMTARRNGWDEAGLQFSTNADSGLHRPARVVLDSSRAAGLGLTVRGPAQWDSA